MAARKAPLERYGESMVRGLQKVAAAALGEVLKDVEDQIGSGRRELERIASCTCTPAETIVVDKMGVEERVEVHARDCPARR